MSTIADLVRAHADDPRPALLSGDQVWTYADYVQGCADRAALLRHLVGDAVPHIGILLDNVPEYPLWLGAAALAGATLVGINPTRRGAELERDISFTDCQAVVTSSAQRRLLDGLDLGPASQPGQLLDVDTAEYGATLAAVAGAALPDPVADPLTRYLLVFTSGTSGAPKAVIFSQARALRMGARVAEMVKMTPLDVAYCVMPLFHTNSLVCSWIPALAAGAAVALRPKFSASHFLPNVRRYGVTYFNYVGKPLTYVLATPEQPDDADNPLQRVFGNEAADADIARFAQRFGCSVTDAYGSTESTVSVGRTPDTPPGALGRAAESVVVLNPETGEECPRARFDADGRLANPDEAIGELVNHEGAATFEGYWKNEEASAARIKGSAYHSGDLAYRDAAGFLYFAGRSAEWLRVDGENLATAPIERLLDRCPGVLHSAVYGVPDPDVGDALMAALLLEPGATFDPDTFFRFLTAQPDLGTKWLPTYVRVVHEFPLTPTNKVLKRVLQRERWESADPTWWRAGRDAPLAPVDDAVRQARRDRFAQRGRTHLLDTV